MKYVLVAVTEELRNIEREIQKTKKHLYSLQSRYRRAAMKVQPSTEEQRLKKLESELRKEYPKLKFSKSLLRLVGTLPNNPPSMDKQITREIIAERYDD